MSCSETRKYTRETLTVDFEDRTGLAFGLYDSNKKLNNLCSSDGPAV